MPTLREITWIALVFVAGGFLASTPASAQTLAPPPGRARVGLGVAISDAGNALAAASGSAQTSGLMTAIFMPIEVTRRFRLEPEVAFLRNATMQTLTGPPAAAFESTTTSWRLGTGLFGSSSDERFTLYYGARVGYLRGTSTTSGSTTAPTSLVVPGFFVAPTIGGEYLLSERLSLGAEVQVRYSRWSWRDSNGTQSETAASTHGVLVLRFYFR